MFFALTTSEVCGRGTTRGLSIKETVTGGLERHPVARKFSREDWTGDLSALRGTVKRSSFAGRVQRSRQSGPRHGDPDTSEGQRAGTTRTPRLRCQARHRVATSFSPEMAARDGLTWIRLISTQSDMSVLRRLSL